MLWSDTQDETLCRPCGGQRTEYIHPDYEWITEAVGMSVMRTLRRREERKEAP